MSRLHLAGSFLKNKKFAVNYYPEIDYSKSASRQNSFLNYILMPDYVEDKIYRINILAFVLA